MSLLMMARRGAVVSGGGGGGFTYANDFSSGSLTPVLPPTTNTKINQWTPPTGVSWNASDPYITTSEAPSGKTHSLAFDYPITAVDAGTNREQNISFGGTTVGSYWMRFKVKVSSNFTMRNSTLPGQPNKFFQFWQSTYGTSTTSGVTFRSGNDTGCIAQFFTTGNYGAPAPADGSWDFLGQVQNATFPSSVGNRFIYPLGSPTPGIIIPGQWHDIQYTQQYSSSPTALDGKVEMRVDGTVFMVTGATNVYTLGGTAAGPPGVCGGYLMGYSNTGYNAVTSFYWADFFITDVNPGWGF